MGQEIKYEVKYTKEENLYSSEYFIRTEDGGVATIHWNGDLWLTTYYQSRALKQEIDWDELGEGKAYCHEWHGKIKVDKEMIEDALHWLCCGTTPIKFVKVKNIKNYG